MRAVKGKLFLEIWSLVVVVAYYDAAVQTVRWRVGFGGHPVMAALVSGQVKAAVCPQVRAVADRLLNCGARALRSRLSLVRRLFD